MQDKITSALVQAKIKRIMTSRKMMGQTDSSVPIKVRFKSICDQKCQPQGQKINPLGKPRSSFYQRPLSSKYVSTYNMTNNSTNSNTHSQAQYYRAIQSNIQHNPKLKNYFMSKNLNKQYYCEKIIQNQLFIMSIMSKMQNINPQNLNQTIEKDLIFKVEKIVALEKQEERCLQCENKIKNLIDSRLQSLKKK